MKKLNFSELAQEMEVLSQEETRKIKGGYWSVIGEEVEVDYYNPIIYWPIEGYTYYSSGGGGYYGGEYDNYQNYGPHPIDGEMIDGALQSMYALKSDSNIVYKQEGDYNLRTADTPEALKYMDCSEFVCRYLAELGFTPTVSAMNTQGLLNYAANNPTLMQKVNTPQPGDIFIWRDGDNGHTGIITNYDFQTGKVTTLESISESPNSGHPGVTYAGIIEQTYDINSRHLTNHPGWDEGGFFRLNEM